MRSFLQRRKSRGFTLIELLIVVAIIGIIAIILIPNLLDALQKAKQKRTMTDMKLVGTAWFSWVTDQISAAAAGAGQASISWDSLFTARDLDSLRSDLIPIYTVEVPELDGWRRSYEFGIASTLEAPLPMAIRSSGSDGFWEGPDYTVGPFIATDYRKDIVWAGGFFIRWPTNLATGG